MFGDDNQCFDFDDEPTVIDVNDDDLDANTPPPDSGATTQVSVAVLLSTTPDETESATPEGLDPPPLPFQLQRRKVEKKEDAWVEELSGPARAVLEQARTVAPGWPLARRVPGAVATPTESFPAVRINR